MKVRSIRKSFMPSIAFIAFINGNLVNAKLLCRSCTRRISALRNAQYAYVHGPH